MLSTGETVRVLMDQKEMNVQELAKITGLKEAAILNVIYNRTNRPEYLNRIAEALEVPIENLLKTKKDHIVNINVYSQATKIVLDELEFFNIQELSYNALLEYTDIAYQQLTNNCEMISVTAYIKGMIDGHSKFGLIKKTKKQ
jgi:transcriptional regulator with XRE-family HTH domain